MTAFDGFDQLDRRIADALEEIAMPRPPEYLDHVLQRTAGMSQRPPLLIPWRFLSMNRVPLAAAAALVVAVLGAAMLFGRSPATSGGPSPSPIASPAPSPSAAAAVPLPQLIRGSWVADAQLGLRAQGPRIQLNFDWDAGRSAGVQTNYIDGPSVFESDSLAASDGQIRLRSRSAGDGCAAGDIGTYGWSRSADGAFLTLTLVADDCSARATTLARTWVRALNGVNDGGRGVLPVDGLELTLPDRKFGLSEFAGGAYDRTWDTTPLIEFLAVKNPVPFVAPCASPLVAGTALTSAKDVVAYLQAQPAFVVTTEAATVAGLPATHVMGAPRAGYVCSAGGDTGMFHGTADSWTISPDNTEALSVWVVQSGADAWLFWYRGDEVTPADEAAVITSIRFMTTLPTP